MKEQSSKKKEKIKHVGIWIRVSTEDQAHGESPEHHEKRAQFYAEAKDWKVREVYHLEAVSGKAVLSHPEAQRMLKDIKSGHISGLIFSKLARLARNTRELLDFSDIFREYDADLISLQEAIDTTSPAGRLFYTMIAAMAQWEREEISERVAASVPIRAKLGKPLGGQAPFGYQWKDKKLIPDPKEAPIRKLIHELFLEIKRKKTVANLLNEKGYRTRNGSKFSGNTVARLLTDPTSKGLRRANYTKSLGEKKHWELKPEEEWIYTKVEPIISEELWDQCNLIVVEQKKGWKRPAKKPVQLFGGLTYCDCGHKMYVPSNTPKYVCYKCRNKISVEDLNGIFHEQLKNFFFSSKEIAGYLDQADNIIKEKEELLKTLDSEQKKVKGEMDQLYNLYIAGEIPKEGFGDKYRPLDDRVKQLKDQVPELQGELDFLRIQYLSSDQIISEAKDLYTRWPQLVHEEKRKVVENITENILISKDEVAINLCYIPSSSEMMAKSPHNFMDSSPPLV
ncbi:MAG: recombinase family protein [Nitrospinales bacterium]